MTQPTKEEIREFLKAIEGYVLPLHRTKIKRVFDWLKSLAEEGNG